MAPRTNIFARAAALAQRERAIVAITLAAVVVRLRWNLFVHPPSSYAFSDMGGYLERADEMFVDAARAHTWFGANWQPRPHTTVFPWGTHALVFLVKIIYGQRSHEAVDAAFGLLGAAAVGFAYATARRLWPARPLVTFGIGVLLVFYYPWISLSGYFLSEPGFMACLSAFTFYSLRLADRGHARDAVALGLAAGVGAVFRPQMLLSVVLVFAVIVWRRRCFPRLRRRLVFAAAAPLALFLAISSARMAFHNRTLGLVSTNGPLNYVFGRCHALGLDQKAPDAAGFFGPPAFGMILDYEKLHHDAWFKLEPVTTTLKLDGYMWDDKKLARMAQRCVRKTGWAKQGSFAATHVVMLWAYNAIWPDTATRGTNPRITRWSHAVLALQPLPLLVALALALRRRRARELLLAVHVVALVAIAVVYFGDTRLRAPYDGIIWTLCASGCVAVARVVRTRLGPWLGSLLPSGAWSRRSPG